MIRKNTSAKFSHDIEVGGRCRAIRGCLASESLISWRSCYHDMQFAPWVGPGDLLAAIEEFGVAVVLMAGVGDPCRALPPGRRRPAASVARGQHDRGPARRPPQPVPAGATAQATPGPAAPGVPG